jgi:hypothetical protein
MTLHEGRMADEWHQVLWFSGRTAFCRGTRTELSSEHRDITQENIMDWPVPNHVHRCLEQPKIYDVSRSEWQQEPGNTYIRPMVVSFIHSHRILCSQTNLPIPFRMIIPQYRYWETTTYDGWWQNWFRRLCWWCQRLPRSEHSGSCRFCYSLCNANTSLKKSTRRHPALLDCVSTAWATLWTLTADHPPSWCARQNDEGIISMNRLRF